MHNELLALILPLKCLTCLVTKGVDAGLIWPESDLLLQLIFIHMVVGDEHDSQINVNLFGNLKIGVFRRPVAEDQGAPRPLRPEERENLRVTRIDRNINSVPLGTGGQYA